MRPTVATAAQTFDIKPADRDNNPAGHSGMTFYFSMCVMTYSDNRLYSIVKTYDRQLGWDLQKAMDRAHVTFALFAG